MHMNRLFQRAGSLLFALVVAFALTGCFGGPSGDVIEKAIAKQQPYIKPGVFYNLADYKVTNQYSREINGETVYTVEYTGNITASAELRRLVPNRPDMEKTIQGTVSMVKRGDAWYFVD